VLILEQRFAEQYEDFHYLSILGDNLIPFIRGDVSLLELFRGSDVLDHVYKHTYSVPEYNSYLGSLVKQLSHKHKQMEILEIGKYCPSKVKEKGVLTSSS